MVLIREKKGFFFVLMAIFLISLFISSYIVYDLSSERISSKVRGQTINDFASFLFNSLEREVYINGYRTIFLIQRDILENNAYVSNVHEIFEESFFNESFKGTQDLILKDTGRDYLLDYYTEYAKKMNLNLVIETISFSVLQNNPWEVDFNWTIGFNISDFSGMTNISSVRSIVASIPITEFYDPIYSVETSGKISNKFTQSIYSKNYSLSSSNFSEHILGSFYFTSSSAPNFLKRLEGNFSPDSNGIESFVNLQKLSLQDISIKQKTVLDYVYFSSENPLPVCSFADLPSWFRVDPENGAKYGLIC